MPLSLFIAGLNSQGQLGDGTTNQQYEPVQVSTDLVFVDITAGKQHTCGLLSNGSYACWGTYSGGLAQLMHCLVGDY